MKMSCRPPSFLLFLQMIIITTTLLGRGVESLPNAEPLMKFIYKELEVKEMASCLVVILGSGLDAYETQAFLKEAQLPIYVYSSKDYQSAYLKESSSYCRKHLLAFRSLAGIQDFMESNSKTLAQHQSIYMWAVIDPSSLEGLRASFKKLILAPVCNKLKKIVLLGRDNTLKNNEVFWVLMQKYTKDDKHYAITVWRKDRLLRNDMELFQDQLRTFLGRSLRVSSFPYKPFITVEKVDENGIITEFGGIETQILKVLAQKLNFDYGTISLPTDGQKWGSELPNGSFTGLVGDVMFERTDIGYAQFFVTPSRMDRIDFTQPYDTDYLCFVVAKPPPLPQWLSLALPLQVPTWSGVGMAILGSIGFYYIYARFAKNLEPPYTFMNGIFFYIGTFFDASQSLTTKISHLSIRLAYAIYLLAIFVVTIGYRGSLISFLSVPHQSPPIDTIKQLAEVSTPVASFGPVFYNTLASSTDGEVKKIYDKFVVHYDFEEAFRNLSNREVVMSEGRRFLDYSIRERFTNKFGFPTVHIMRECFNSFRIAFATSKNGIYTERLGDKIIQLNEGGIIEKWIRDELDLTARLSKSETITSHNTLTISTLQGPFFLWLLTIGISLFTFTYEILSTSTKEI